MLSPDEWITPVDNNNFGLWREWLKRELLHKRHYRSDWSKRQITLQTGCEMHEGILSRASVPKGIWWHYKLYHEYNSFLLLPEEHRPQPPSRSWCIGYMSELYGKDILKEWFESLPWRSKPPFILF